MTPRRLLVAGVLGSALVALGGLVSWLGVALLGAAWWASRQLGVRHQRAACLLWALPLLVAAPLYSRDLHAYAGQAALVVAGRDPYAVGPGALPGALAAGVDDVWLDAPSPYGPVWLWLAGLVVRVTGEAVVPAVLGLRLLAVLGVVLAAWALGRLARRPGAGAVAGRREPAGAAALRRRRPQRRAHGGAAARWPGRRPWRARARPRCWDRWPRW